MPEQSSSIWKKELRLGRKPRPVADADRALAREEPIEEEQVEIDLLPGHAEEPASEIDARLAEARAAVFGALTNPATEPVPVVAADPIAVLRAAVLEATVEHESESLPEPTAPVKAEKAPKPAKQSIWKKELGRKRTAEPAPVANVETAAERVPAPQVEAAAEPAPPAPEKAPSQPFWKKEISFGKSSKPKAAKTPKAKAGSKSKGASAPKKSTSLAKREIRLSRPSFSRGVSTRKASTGPIEKLVGLRIGSSQLAAALIHNNGSAQLLQLARTPLEPGVVEGGEVRDSDALGQALKGFFAEHKLPRTSVRLGVATNRIGVRVLEVPAVDDPKLLANAIRFRAQELIPIPIADAVLDHVLLGDAVGEDGSKQRRVLLVFAHRELVDGYLEACRRAGLKLAGIDFDAFALLRALNSRDGAGERRAALVAVSIGHDRTIFAVSDGEVCDFARVLDWGGASVDAALAAARGIEAGAAETLKRTLSLRAEDAGDGSIETESALAAVREELQVLSRELLSSLQFYQSREGSLDIGEVLLTGGGAQLKGIDEELTRQIGVPVRVADPLARVTAGGEFDRPDDAGSLAIAVGLGIEA